VQSRPLLVSSALPLAFFLLLLCSQITVSRAHIHRLPFAAVRNATNYRYYFYDGATCPDGVNATTGGCSADQILTSSNVHTITRDAFPFLATGARTDTPVVSGSDTKLTKYEFCATPANLISAKLDEMCLSFTLLYRPFPIAWLSALTSVPTQNDGTYSCGTNTQTITLFDFKVDTGFSGINYGTATDRLGMRFMAASMTGGLTFNMTATVSANDATFAQGPIDLAFDLTVNGTSGSYVTCGTGTVGDVKVMPGGDLAITSAGTTCGCVNI
jgi:hypothetical protein